jgi:hypothetical protein
MYKLAKILLHLRNSGKVRTFKLRDDNFSLSQNLSKCLLVSILFFHSGQALAIPARVVYSQDAQNLNSVGVELKVWSGYGLTINFIPTGEVIKDVWIGDPSRIGFTSNGNLCPKVDSNNSDAECIQSVATVLFLRQIKPISIPNMTNSSDGSTQITVITNGDSGQKQYQFKLTPATGKPAYTSLVIKPDSEKPAPLLLAQNQLPNITTKQSSAPEQTATPTTNQNVATASNTPTRRNLTPGTSTPRNDANAVVAGLAIAGRNGQIKPGTTTWNKVQDVVRLLRQGKTREEAISRSSIDARVFNQLIQWGKVR